MTREEARNRLLNYLRFIVEGTDLWEAIDMAIEALKGDAESATTNLYDVQLAKDLLGISEEAEKHQLSGETPTNTPTCNHTCNQKQITGKLESVENATSEGEELTMGQPKSKLETDIISRQAAGETFCALCNGKRFGECEYSNICQSLRALQSVPPVTPTERIGEWIKSEIPNELYVCSECGGACWSYDYERNIVKSNFCPSCGCAMDNKGE